MDNWIVSITAGNQQITSIKKCKQMGLKVFAVDNNPDAIGFNYSDAYFVCDINEISQIISEINNTELLCKKNPQISNSIFFNFFSEICKKASNFS